MPVMPFLPLGFVWVSPDLRDKLPSDSFSANLDSFSANLHWENALNVEVLHIQGIVFDELAPRLDVLAHQGSEDGLGFGDVFELDLEQGAAFGVHGGFPKLR